MFGVCECECKVRTAKFEIVEKNCLKYKTSYKISTRSHYFHQGNKTKQIDNFYVDLKKTFSHNYLLLVLFDRLDKVARGYSIT